jgi:hypothetical protein
MSNHCTPVVVHSFYASALILDKCKTLDDKYGSSVIYAYLNISKKHGAPFVFLRLDLEIRATQEFNFGIVLNILSLRFLPAQK